MANWKRAKKARKRAYLKRLPDHHTVNAEGMELLGYRVSRVNQSGDMTDGKNLHNKEPSEEMLVRCFGMERVWIRRSGTFVQTEELQHPWRNDTRQGHDEVHRVRLFDGPKGIVWLQFVLNEFYFIEQDRFGGERKSIMYGNRDRAMIAYKLGKIAGTTNVQAQR